jgi:hypothetical protein
MTLFDTVNIFTKYCLFCSLNDENLAYGTGFNANESKRKRDSEEGGLITLSPQMLKER